MNNIIDGRLVSEKTREVIKRERDALVKQYGIEPGLAVILVGDDPASAVYVRNKHKGCLSCGFRSIEIRMESTVSEDTLLQKIDELNQDPLIHGILVQLPLPKHIDEKKIQYRISPYKDVDAFHPENVGKIMTGDARFLPCTPAGIIRLIEEYHVDPTGKRCVVLGRSNIVGKPMMHLMLEKNATVTVCHSKTPNIADIAREADILIVAIGVPKYVSADMVKEGAVVIDVGINRLDDGTLVGDVDFEHVAPKASLITPVPGGVGPMTITMLLENTLNAAKLSAEESMPLSKG